MQVERGILEPRVGAQIPPSAHYTSAIFGLIAPFLFTITIPSSLEDKYVNDQRFSLVQFPLGGEQWIDEFLLY